MLSRRPTAHRGFTVIDSLIAIVLVIAAITGLLGFIPYSFGQMEHDSILVQANVVGQQMLDAVRYDEQIRAPLPAATTVPIDYGSSYTPGGTMATTGTFSVSDSCTALAGSGLIYDCTVLVTWTDNNASRQLNLETYVTPGI